MSGIAAHAPRMGRDVHYAHGLLRAIWAHNKMKKAVERQKISAEIHAILYINLNMSYLV